MKPDVLADENEKRFYHFEDLLPLRTIGKELFRDIESESSLKIDKYHPILLLGIILIESWIFVITLQYWWWGEIYMKTTWWWVATLFALISFPSGLLTKNFKKTLLWNALILLVPVIACGIVMVLLVFGLYQPLIHRYFYRNPGLMIFSIFWAFWSLGWKFYSYNLALHRKEAESRNSLFLHRLSYSLISLTDIIWTAGFSLLLMNIEGIYAIL